jgi:hypothetical protein
MGPLKIKDLRESREPKEVRRQLRHGHTKKKSKIRTPLWWYRLDRNT